MPEDTVDGVEIEGPIGGDNAAGLRATEGGGVKTRSTGITVVGGFLIAMAFYFSATQPWDGLTLFLCAWLCLSGVGLIAQKRAAFTLYLVGWLILPIKAGLGAYSTGDFVSAGIGVGILLVAFGVPALFVWARSEYLQPWFPKEAA